MAVRTLLKTPSVNTFGHGHVSLTHISHPRKVHRSGRCIVNLYRSGALLVHFHVPLVRNHDSAAPNATCVAVHIHTPNGDDPKKLSAPSNDDDNAKDVQLLP